MKNCDTCENYFCSLKSGSPCEPCLKRKGRKGYRRAKPKTLIRIWLHQLRLVLER